MNKNIGNVDKNIRIVLGVALLILGYYFDSWWGLIGLVPLLTSLIGWCPAYAPFKFSTAKGKTDNT